MPQVDLSTLNGVELRQLLDASRRRGDAALSYKVLQEMAVRRDAPGARRGFLGRSSAEPHPADVELGAAGEAAEDDDVPPMPNWRAPAAEPAPESLASSPVPEAAFAPRRGRRRAQPAPAAALQPPLEAPIPTEEAELDRTAPDISRPLNMWDGEPAGIEKEAPGERAPDEWAQEPPSRGGAVARSAASDRPRLRLVVGFALGIAVGGTLGFWVGQMPLEVPLSRPPAAASVQIAALAPAPAPALPAPAAAAPPREAAPHAATVAPAPPATAPEAAADADSRAGEPPPPLAVPATAEPAPAAAAAAPAGCARKPTPADRAICGDPQLRRLQGELRQAYAQALKAHTDRALLRQRQLAWRDSRDAVTDPHRLAQLYEQRIHKLNAAKAAARRHR